MMDGEFEKSSETSVRICVIKLGLVYKDGRVVNELFSSFWLYDRFPITSMPIFYRFCISFSFYFSVIFLFGHNSLLISVIYTLYQDCHQMFDWLRTVIRSVFFQPN